MCYVINGKQIVRHNTTMKMKNELLSGLVSCFLKNSRESHHVCYLFVVIQINK